MLLSRENSLTVDTCEKILICVASFFAPRLFGVISTKKKNGCFQNAKNQISNLQSYMKAFSFLYVRSQNRNLE
jgi:hypothetical protein